MTVMSKLKRLRSLSMDEIRFRLGEKLIIARERKHLKDRVKAYYSDDFNLFSEEHASLQKVFQSNEIVTLSLDRRYFRTLADPLDADKAAIFKKQFPEKFALSIDRAEKFLQNRFQFLGVSFQLPDPIPWQSDPVSLKPFPTGFYEDIDIFTNQNPGDVKHVWEVNRLQFLIEIAKAYYLTGDVRYQKKVDDLISDWYRKNPFQTGIAWASALEVGVRALALIWTLYFYSAGQRPNPDTMRTILKILYWSARHLNDHLSLYFSPYNHLIGETAALFAIGFLFPVFKEADGWASRALQILNDQVEKQFHADGGSVEQATFYHHFTLGFYLQTISLLKHNGQTVPQKMLRRVEKALEFSMYMMRPDGALPFIGDIDDARSIYFSDPTNWDFRSYQCFGAAWFEREDMKFMSGGLQEDAFWMLSEEEKACFAKLGEKAPHSQNIILKHSGYYIFRSGFKADAHFSFMDAGPLADGVFHDERSSAAHGHADLLAIEIAPFGESLLIDPGFSNYRGAYDWHSYFRSTAAHNTLTINRQSQAKQTGILKWSFAPRFKVLRTVGQERLALVEAEHYGFQRLPHAPVHRRLFAFVDQTFWLAIDSLFAQDAFSATVQWYFHFNQKTKVAFEQQNREFRVQGPGAGLQLLFEPLFSAEWQQHIFEGGQEPQEGWISPTYRARTPAPLLEITAETAFPLQALTLFLPTRKEEQWQIRRSRGGIELQFEKQMYRIETDEAITLQIGEETISLVTRVG